MYRLRPTDTWKTQRSMEVGVNARGVHFFSGRWAVASVDVVGAWCVQGVHFFSGKRVGE